jgi:hypothetical protein
MFKVIVTVCLIIDPSKCMFIENIQYPVVYETFEQCKARALEIGSDVPNYIPQWRAIRWKCLKIREGKFT